MSARTNRVGAAQLLATPSTGNQMAQFMADFSPIVFTRPIDRVIENPSGQRHLIPVKRGVRSHVALEV